MQVRRQTQKKAGGNKLEGDKNILKLRVLETFWRDRPSKKMVIGLTPVGSLVFIPIFLLKKIPPFICCLLYIVLNICLLIG